MENDTVEIYMTPEEQRISVRVYSVDCECGEHLRFHATADRDNDLIVTVKPHKCEEE